MYPLLKRATPAALLLILASCSTNKRNTIAHHTPIHFVKPGKGQKAIPAAYISETVPITWKGGPAGNVAISLIDCCSTSDYRGINPSVHNSGSYNWTVPVDLPSGLYTIYITETGTPSSGWNYSVPIAILRKDPDARQVWP